MQLKCNMNSLSAASQVVSLKWVLQEAYAAWLFGNCAGRKPPASALAAEVARGVSRLLLTEGCSPILEFTLPNGRRLDVAALGPGDAESADRRAHSAIGRDAKQKAAHTL